MSKFDLEKALAGEPVILRNGAKAYVRHHEEQVRTTFPLIGYVANGGTAGEAVTWSVGGHFYRSHAESVYDIVGMWIEPPKFEHWGLLNEDIKYIAKDYCGRWYGYKSEPTIGRDMRWNIPSCGGCYPLYSLNPNVLPECDWEHSLIARPENE